MIKKEIRRNLILKLQSKEKLFSDIIGYDQSVIFRLQHALLANENVINFGIVPPHKPGHFCYQRASQPAAPDPGVTAKHYSGAGYPDGRIRCVDFAGPADSFFVNHENYTNHGYIYYTTKRAN
ncbi:MAG TPA: hypothetical protein VK106_05075 [Balneolaceae bacterium]|nr:hypothetical protein [Balneolaceae bacterium]